MKKNWRLVQLKDIGKIVSGGTPSTSNSLYWSNEISWITPADLSGYESKYISRGRKSISKKGLENSSAKLLPKGSVLFSSRAPIGYVAIASGELATNQGFKNIIPSKVVSADFLYYYLKASKHLAEKSASGTTFKEISGKKFGELPFPLPPLPDQHAIVSKIEELLSELDKGKQQLETAQQQLKIYRQAVLKWAFEGKLSASEFSGLQNEQNGNATKSNSVKSSNSVNSASDNLPKGWALKTFNELGSWRGGGTPSKSRREFWENGDIMWVSPKDMKSKVIHDTIDKITLDAIENSSTKLIPKGSILFVVRSGILRRALPIALTVSEVTVNQDLQAFTPKELLPEYVYWYVAAKNDDIRKVCSKDGTTVESIESSALKNYLIPVCSLKEQKSIVQEIESRLSVCDKVEETITTSLAQAETLRQSILKKAFEGKLV